jgi:hypothetical protein
MTASAYKKPGSLTQAQFVELVSIMKKHRLAFEGKWPHEIVGAVAEELGKTPAPSAIRRAATSAGFVLRSQERKPKEPQRAALIHPVTRGDVILARELIRLTQSLGEKPSEQLVMLAKGVVS